jgi:hypothetical protein
MVVPMPRFSAFDWASCHTASLAAWTAVTSPSVVGSRNSSSSVSIEVCDATSPAW